MSDKVQTFRSFIYDGQALMREDDEGQWVYLHDHACLLAERDARIAELEATPPAAEVDDAMVDRAAKAFLRVRWHGAFAGETSERLAIRAALTAALRPFTEEGNGNG